MMKSQFTQGQLVRAVLLFPFNALATIIDLFFCIPILGRLIKLVWNTILTMPHFVLGMGELLLWQMGFQPVKKLKLGVVVLLDKENKPQIDEERIIDSLKRTGEIFLERAKVKIVPAVHIPKHLSNQDAPSEHWIQYADHQTSRQILDVDCDLEAIVQDLLLHGTSFQWINLRQFFFTSFRRVFGYGSPVTVFIVRSIKEKSGCSLGWFTDYVTVPKSNLRCIPHEVGHACNLFHRKEEKENLMYPFNCRPTKLTPWQVAVLRSSRHVTIV
jgi:hypothetical protein